MQDMAHSICLIKLYQITMRKKFRFFVSDYLKRSLEHDRKHVVQLLQLIEIYSDQAQLK